MLLRTPIAVLAKLGIGLAALALLVTRDTVLATPQQTQSYRLVQNWAQWPAATMPGSVTRKMACAGN